MELVADAHRLHGLSRSSHTSVTSRPVRRPMPVAAYSSSFPFPLAAAVSATGKPVVLVLVEGRPRLISRITDAASAILMAYNPGNEGGQAIADVLFGDYNPGGKLPFTYPRFANALNPRLSARR